MVAFRSPVTWKRSSGLRDTDLNREIRDQLRRLQSEVLVLQSSLTGVVNTGTIVPFAGATATIPSGWLLCDGRAYPKASAPDLATLLGDSYGTATTLNFYLPDFRGKMMRGETILVQGSIASRGSSTGSASPASTNLSSSITFNGVAGNTDALGSDGDHSHDANIAHVHSSPHTHTTSYNSTGHTHSFNSHSHNTGGPSATRNNGTGTANVVASGTHDHSGFSTGFGSATSTSGTHNAAPTGSVNTGGVVTPTITSTTSGAHTHGSTSRQHTHTLTHDHGSFDTLPPYIELNYLIKT